MIFAAGCDAIAPDEVSRHPLVTQQRAAHGASFLISEFNLVLQPMLVTVRFQQPIST